MAPLQWGCCDAMERPRWADLEDSEAGDDPMKLLSFEELVEEADAVIVKARIEEGCSFYVARQPHDAVDRLISHIEEVKGLARDTFIWSHSAQYLQHRRTLATSDHRAYELQLIARRLPDGRPRGMPLLARSQSTLPAGVA